LNAGAQFGTTKHRTSDGFESTFAINHLAHYLLLRLLAPGLAKNATIVITTSDVHDPKQVPIGPKELNPEALAHPKDKGGFMPGMRAYASSKLCNLLTARAFEASLNAQSNGVRVIAYNPGLTRGTSLFREWPWWAKLMMAVASRLRSTNTIEQAGNAIASGARNDCATGQSHIRLTGEGQADVAGPFGVGAERHGDEGAMGRKRSNGRSARTGVRQGHRGVLAKNDSS
jgi:NAD(P)-dependent dehydrogenase (short-subunit alcohol dehydrogenase family)